MIPKKLTRVSGMGKGSCLVSKDAPNQGDYSGTNHSAAGRLCLRPDLFKAESDPVDGYRVGGQV